MSGESGEHPNWYRLAEEAVTELGLAVRRGAPLQLDALIPVARGIVADFTDREELVVKALSGPSGSPLITNLVNVGILSVKLGMGLNYSQGELERVALAGLLHDIGIFAIPESILLKRDVLSDSERQMLEQHPELGADLISVLGASYDWLALVIRQAHERWAGQGYPQGMRGDDIHEYAQIIGMADVFEAMVNPRPYHKRLFPQEAIKIFLNENPPAFSRNLIQILLKQLSAFPTGTMVRLNTGALGVVSQVNRAFPMRPLVQLMSQGNDPSSDRSDLLDLSKSPQVHIIETVEPPAVDRFEIDPSQSLEAHQEHLASSEAIRPLLEPLNTIACLLESRITSETERPAQLDSEEPAEPSPSQAESSSSEFSDPEFQEEVLELFSLEAQEWLLQIQSALRKLESNPPPKLCATILELLVHGLTTLGGSAAIVALPNLEQKAYALVSRVKSIRRDHEGILPPEDVASLREQFDLLCDEIDQVVALPPSLHADDLEEREGDDDIDGDDAWEEDIQQDEPVHHIDSIEDPSIPLIESASTDTQSNEEVEFRLEPDFPSRAIPVSEGQDDPSDEPPPSLYESLKALHETQQETFASNRHVCEHILKRVESECGPALEPLDPDVLNRLLDEHAQQDVQFLKEFEDNISPLSEAIDALRNGDPHVVITNETLEPILQRIQELQSQATTIHATSLILFLNGLLSFLNVVAHRQVASALPRLQAFEMRVTALRPMAQQWVEVGEVERAAIRQLIPDPDPSPDDISSSGYFE